MPRSRHRREAAQWCRSPHRLAQVPGHPGAGPKKWWSPAPRNCFQCFPVAQDSKRKTDLLRLAGGPAPPAEGTCSTGRGDLRRKKGGPAPPEGRPAPPAEGTCAAKLLPVLPSGAGLKEKNRPAPLGRRTCATSRRDLLHRERGLTPEGGPAPPGEGTGATRRKTCATRRRDLLLRGRT